MDAGCLAATVVIGCRYGIRTLDAIHLAAAVRLPCDVVLVSLDPRQREVAPGLGLSTLGH